MSFDLAVYGARAVSADQLAVLASELGATWSGENGEVTRMVRGRPVHVLGVDGPLGVEREDLPEAVADNAVGVTVLYELMVEGSGRPGIALARKLARALAEVAGGVVYDPQEDAVSWPRGSARRFRPSAVRRVDVLRCEWYIRREDMPADLPDVLLAGLRSWLPEAVPRRFGGFEPLQHKLDSDDLFRRSWRVEAGGLYWKGMPPVFGGRTFGLAEDTTSPHPVPDHPVGSFDLDLDLRALDDHRWRADLIGMFNHLVETVSACYAHAFVSPDWEYSRGTLWTSRHDAPELPLAIGHRWHGLPPYPVWLAWCGPLYLPLVDGLRGNGFHHAHGGLLRYDGEHPRHARHPVWPEELTMRLSQSSPVSSYEAHPAPVLPAGL